MATSSTVLLPRITIQHTFFDVVNEICSGGDVAVEDTWISCYKEGFESVHGRLRVSEGEGKGSYELTSREGVNAEVITAEPATVLVSCEALTIPPTPVHFPLSTPFTLRGGIDAFHISPNGARAVIGGKDGAVRIVSLRDSAKSLELKGHVGDIRDAIFFPSSEVVLTCSSDLRIRVFSALDGSNPRTFTGHTKAVTSLAILGVGRVVVSSSLDGSVRLWTVGTSSNLDTITFTQPINAMIVSQLGLSPAETSNYPDVPDGLVAFVAHANGTASVFSLSAAPNRKRSIRTLAAGTSPLFAIAYHPGGHIVATGSRDGTVSLFDLTTPSSGSYDTPFLSFRRSTSSILSLSFGLDASIVSAKPSTLLVGAADGLPFRVGLSVEQGSLEVTVKEEFAGLDCDAAIAKEAQGYVWVAGADGKLRKYGSECRLGT